MTEEREHHQQPQLYNYSVKLETTQKCVNVVVYSNDDYETTNLHALQALKDMRFKLEREGFAAAPIVSLQDLFQSKAHCVSEEP
jgi:hypothetical protein